MTRLTLLALLVAAASAACGKKPEAPKAPAPPPAADRGPSTTAVDAGAVPLVTPGGVALEGAPEAVARAAAALATRPDSATRELIALGDAAAPVAVALLESKNLVELEGALAFLREVTHPSAVKPITGLLSHDAEAVRDAARRTLARYDGVGLAAGVIPLLASDAAALRIDAARALARIGGDDARGALVKRLDDPDDGVLLEVAAALGHIGGAVPQGAIDALAADDARPAQLRAALSLARRVGLVAPASAIARGLSADDPALASDAARAIASAPDDDRGRLVAMAWESTRLDTRRALLEGLTSHPAAAARARAEALARGALTDADPGLRAIAADALGRLIPPLDAADASSDLDADRHGPLPALLLPLLADTAPLVRRTAAARLVAALPHPAVIAAVDARLDDEPDAGTRQVFIYALARVGTRDALGRVIARVADEALGPASHLALMRVSGEQHPRDAAAWRAWLERALDPNAPPAEPAPETTSPPEGHAPSGDEAPKAPPAGQRPKLTGVPG